MQISRLVYAAAMISDRVVVPQTMSNVTSVTVTRLSPRDIVRYREKTRRVPYAAASLRIHWRVFLLRLTAREQRTFAPDIEVVM